MKRVLLLLLLLVSIVGLGQEAVIEWQQSLGGSGSDYAREIKQTIDGGYIIAGQSASNNGDVTGNHGDWDAWIVKLDISGNIAWQNSIGGSLFDVANSIEQTTDGGYIVAVRSNSSDGDVTGNNGQEDYWIVKLDGLGNITWQNSLGGSGNDSPHSIQQTADGGYIVTGNSSSNNGDVTVNYGNTDYWVVKLDSSGNIVWQKSLGGSGIEWSSSIRQTTDGGYIVAGYSNSNDFDVTGNHGSMDYWVVKLDPTGNVIWEKSLGGTGPDYAYSIEQTIDGGYIVAGSSTSSDGDLTSNSGSIDYWVVKLNEFGNIIWQKSLGGSGPDRLCSIQQITGGGYVIAGFSKSINGDVSENNGLDDYWIVKLDETGNITSQKSLGGTYSDEATSIQETTDGRFIVAGKTGSTDGDVLQNNGDFDIWVVKLNMPNIYGKVYNDINENCILEQNEPGLTGIQVTINPGGYIAEINSHGIWYLDSLPIGTYTSTIDTTNLNWTPTCPVSQSFTVTDPQAHTPGPDFGLVNNNPCSSPDISIYAPFLRRCFSDQKIYIQACNEITATGIMDSAYVEVELDPHFTPTSSSLPYTSLGSNTYLFELGDLYPGQCINFTINNTISCDAILGETLCMDATLYPLDSCALDTIPPPPLPPNYGNNPNLVLPQPCALPWDNSSLQVEGWCQGDSVQFSVMNTGDFGNGDMDCYSPVLLYVNDTLVAIDSIQLQGQETIYYSYPANGETWILAAEQHPLHPGNSHPNAHVELCGSDSTQWIPDLVNNHPLDDAAPFIDIYCGIVTGSYDPNDKRGFPKGVTEQNHIHPNQQLQYIIRFQNTGTDTAFTVVIRDTLDTDLNIFTVTPGVSSHNYTFKKYGPRVLEWTFNDIMLPDSTTDEPGSNGFATFTVDQVPNLPNGTLINNQADIYFDFNDPIITNETDHLINDEIESSPIGDFVVVEITECLGYTWSTTGQTYTQSGLYSEVLTNQDGIDSTVTLVLTIESIDFTSQPTNQTVVVGNNAQFNLVTSASNPTYQWQMDEGTGWNNLSNVGQFSGTDTGILNISNVTLSQNNTLFRCIVTENSNCSDTSEVGILTVDDNVGLQDITKETLRVYPNPTSSSFTISSDEFINSAFKLIDAQGREILTGNMNGKEQIINIAKLSPGAYSIVFNHSELPVLSVIKE